MATTTTPQTAAEPTGVEHLAAVGDAEVAERRAGKACWEVRLLTRTDGGFAGTSRLDATGDTADLAKFYDLVCDQAAHVARLGDTDPLGARKAKALGVIADIQAHLDLSGTDLLGLPDGPLVPRRREVPLQARLPVPTTPPRQNQPTMALRA
jgi:hypothetical protein